MSRTRPRPNRPFEFETEGALDALGVTLRQFNVLADNPAQHDVATATIWTLHLCLSSPPVAETAALLILASRHEGLTGDCHAGDSWVTWCEEIPSDASDASAALHIYFAAPNAATADSVGHDLASLVGVTDPTTICISTGADWAAAVDGASGLSQQRMDVAT